MSVSEPVPPSGSAVSIGAYQILEVLGRGGMGEVFLAWDEGLQRRVAIKRIRHDGEITPTLRQRLLREAQTVAGLSHPAIVHVYELLKDDAGDDCIVMEYVQGRTLAATVEDGPLETALAVRLAAEVASGLAAAHEAGIVHRDLKAENVIVTPSGHAKILDFGLAKPLVPSAGDLTLTMSGLVLGTCRSMSPEQARGAEVDERSDLFSLGVLLFEMLTGQPPFRGSGAVEILTQVISKAPPRVDSVRPAVPPRLGTLVERLLEKEPASRPQTAAEVVRELEALGSTVGSSPASPSGETISELPTGYHTPSSPPLSQPLPRSGVSSEPTTGVHISTRQRRLRIAALVVLAVAILGIAVYFVYHVLTPPPPIRVLVLWPEVKDNEQLSSAASIVLTTSLNTLNALEGVDVYDESDIPGTPTSFRVKGKAAVADELMVTTFERKGSNVWITLSAKYPDGKDRQHRRFSWSGADYQRLAEEVAGHLRKLYSGRSVNPSLMEEDARPEDYARFWQIRNDIRAGKDLKSQLEQLQPVLDNSPRFLTAQLLAVELNLNQFYSTLESPFLESADGLVRQAKDRAPGYFRVLCAQFQLEMAQDSLVAAEKTLDLLNRMRPKDPRLLLFAANLAERKGHPEQALIYMKTLVSQLSTWNNLCYLADIEAKNGHIKEARDAVHKILSVSPENTWALEKQAEIELVFGDAKQAETLYQHLIEGPAQRAEFTNLGIAQALLGNNTAAAENFRQALRLNRDHISATINLADVELALDNKKKSMKLYKQALGRLEGLPQAYRLPNLIMARAQCLAHLGKSQDAVEAIDLALRSSSADPGILSTAALVYAVVDDRTSALVYIKNARAKGVQPLWFQLPAFGPLKNDPKYQSLVGMTPEATPSRR